MAQSFHFSDEMVAATLSQSMHYLQSYFSVYTPGGSLAAQADLTACPVRRGLLLLSILGFSIKILIQDYAIEHLTIREQLALFEVSLPSVNFSPPTDGTHGASGDANSVAQRKHMQMLGVKANDQNQAAASWSIAAEQARCSTQASSHESLPGLQGATDFDQAMMEDEYDHLIDD